MFFIMGSGRKQEYLDFDQFGVCPSCGQYGHTKVIMVYSYFSLFFIPLFKWNKQYYVQRDCCQGYCELDQETGKKIENKEMVAINLEDYSFVVSSKRCSYCGFQTQEDYEYCPKCGNRF